MMCHEFNIFLYFKDKEFFEDVVKPLLNNKKEKKLIDYYLLNDIDNLNKFANISKLGDLNKVELVLLGHKTTN